MYLNINTQGRSSLNNRLPSVFPAQGEQGSTETFGPSGQDLQGKHSGPLGMTNPHLVVASNEGLSGCYCGGAIHF